VLGTNEGNINEILDGSELRESKGIIEGKIVGKEEGK
jgi:hypothetical protein